MKESSKSCSNCHWKTSHKIWQQQRTTPWCWSVPKTPRCWFQWLVNAFHSVRTRWALLHNLTLASTRTPCWPFKHSSKKHRTRSTRTCHCSSSHWSAHSIHTCHTCARPVWSLPQPWSMIFVAGKIFVKNWSTKISFVLTDLIRFPSITFDQAAQRLATGTNSKIFVYDLTSATRWHVLEGHKSNVIAIAFSENGKSLASYSPDDGEVKLWKMGSTIFGILGGNPHCYKTINVSKLDSKYLWHYHIRQCNSDTLNTEPLTVQTIVDLQVRLQWSQKMFLLTRTWEKDPHTKIEA